MTQHFNVQTEAHTQKRKKKKKKYNSAANNINIMACGPMAAGLSCGLRVMSDVQGVVLAVSKSLPAGGTSV